MAVSRDLADDDGIFRLLVETAPDGVAVIQRGRFSYVNPAAVRLLGCQSADEIVGRQLGELMEPADAHLAAHRIGKLLDTGQRFRQPAAYKSRRTNGDVIDVSAPPRAPNLRGKPPNFSSARQNLTLEKPFGMNAILELFLRLDG